MSYVEKLRSRVEKAMQIGTIDKGSVYHVEVQHDDSCPALNTGVNCKCDPFIGIRVKGKVLYITEQGLLTKEVTT